MTAKGLSVTPLSTFYRKSTPVPLVLGQFSDEDANTITMAAFLRQEPMPKGMLVPAPAG